MAGRTNIVLDRLLYYDNDYVVGEFILLPFAEVTVLNIAVEMQCLLKFTYTKPTGQAKKVSAIFYSKLESLVKESYHAQANEKLIYNFGFHVPDGLPPTMTYSRDVVKGLMGSYLGAIHWEICVRADVRGVETLLLRKRFVKSNLYRLPKAVDEIGVHSYNSLFLDDREIRIVAAIPRRIFYKGDKIKVSCSIDNDTLMPVVEVDYACVLHMRHQMATKSMGAQARDIFTDTSMIQTGLPIKPGGKLEFKVKVWPRNTLTARHTSMVHPDMAEWERENVAQNSALLIPSYHLPPDDETGKIGVNYFIRVSALLRKGIKIHRVSVELPFVLADSVPNDVYLPDMCYLKPDDLLFTPPDTDDALGRGKSVLAVMSGAPKSPQVRRKSLRKSDSLLRRLSRSATDLYSF